MSASRRVPIATLFTVALLSLLSSLSITHAYAQDLPIPDPVVRMANPHTTIKTKPAPVSQSRLIAPAAPVSPSDATTNVANGAVPDASTPVAQGSAQTVSSDTVANAPLGGIGTVGPGDTLLITVLGQAGGQSQATVDADGQLVAPLIGSVQASGLTPSAIGHKIASELRAKNYLRDPQVTVEVLALRSRVVSVLGQVERPGRYPLENNLSLLELLAIAGGANNTAGDTVVLVRGNDSNRERIELYVGNRQSPSQAVQNTDLRPGDVVFVPPAPRFFVYGAVGAPGAYPIEQGLNIMRAVSLAGGLTPRASDRRIDINHTDAVTGTQTKKRAELTDRVQAGDVIVVNERIF